jgi:hypothetical protein
MNIVLWVEARHEVLLDFPEVLYPLE